jgi:uncharacterized protein YacL
VSEALFRRIVRAAAGASLVLAGGAAIGVLPWGPVLSVAVALTAVFAAEGWIAARARGDASPASAPRGSREALVDTSVLIDGRLADLCESGFLAFDLVVPEFVLRELQHVADASDRDRRARGRRGLDMLQALRTSAKVRVAVVGDDVPDQADVDLKLVELARRRGAALLTTDFNLNKVAAVHGIKVLNLNELAHAMRPVVIPGETLQVTIVKEGKEAGQGVGYLDDGTMVVVERARDRIGETLGVQVTSVLQQPSGKIIFTKIASEGGS